jgi:hypothetical protein
MARVAINYAGLQRAEAGINPSRLGQAAEEIGTAARREYESVYTQGRVAADALAQGARAVVRGLDEMGARQKAQDAALKRAQAQQEVIGNINASGNLHLQFDSDLANLNASDPAAVHAFEQKYDEAADTAFSGATTPRGMEAQARANQNFRLHAFSAVRTKQAKASGDALAASVFSINQAGDAMAFRHDLASADQTTKDHFAELKAAHPELPGVHFDTLEERALRNNAIANVQGYIQGDPAHNEAPDLATAEKLLHDPKIEARLGDDLPRLEKAITTARGTQVTQANRIREQKGRDAILKFDQTHPADATGNIIYQPGDAEKVEADPDLPQTFKHETLADIRRQSIGVKLHDDPQTLIDFSLRLHDPSHPLSQIDLDNALRAHHLMPRTYAAFSKQMSSPKDPLLSGLLHDAQNEVAQIIRPDNLTAPTPQQIQAITAARNYFANRYSAGVVAGANPRELVDPHSPLYIWGAHPADKIKSFLNAGPPAPPTTVPVVRQRLGEAADLINHVTQMLATSKDIHTTTELLHDNGFNISETDVRDGRFCANLVNAALQSVGIKGSGSDLAVSFAHWGAPVDDVHVQKGDVFLAGPSEMGGQHYTGHVGMVVGAPRMGPHGLQVEVVSSHLEGAASNKGGVEWRDMSELQFRRAQPTLAQIRTGAPSFWERLKGYVFTGSVEPSANASLPATTGLNPRDM